MTLLPGNAAAAEVVRLRSVNNDIDVQIAELRRAQSRNSEIIGALDLTAIWSEVPEPDLDAEEPESPAE